MRCGGKKKKKVGGQMKVNFSRLEIARASQKEDQKKSGLLLLLYYYCIGFRPDTHTPGNGSLLGRQKIKKKEKSFFAGPQEKRGAAKKEAAAAADVLLVF